MSFVALPRQAKLVCDWCSEPAQFDAIMIRFEPSAADLDERVADYGFRRIGECHMCPGCAEERGADPDDPADIPPLARLDRESEQ